MNFRVSTGQPETVEGVYKLEQISYTSLKVPPAAVPAEVGEKAFALAQLQQQGYHVPPGWVVSASLWRQFLSNLNNDPLLADLPYCSLHLDLNDSVALQNVSNRLQQGVIQTPLPHPWRSLLDEMTLPTNSAIVRASIAGVPYSVRGLLPSRICANNGEALELALKQVWASLFSAGSLFYWQRRGVPLESLSLGVLIQSVVNAKVSGRAKVTPQNTRIEVVWGLGHTWVRGEARPETYTMQRGEVKEHFQGMQTRIYRLGEVAGNLETEPLAEEDDACLSQSQLQQLGETLQTLETGQLTFECEWTWGTLGEEEGLYLLQVDAAIAQMVSEAPPDRPLARGIGAAPGYVVAPAYHLHKGVSQEGVSAVPPGQILVVKELSWATLPLLHQAAGLVAQTGSMTSHEAILARELGIPAIVGAAQAMAIPSGAAIALDGTRGEVWPADRGEPPSTPQVNSRQFWPTATRVMLNLSQLRTLDAAAQLPSDGVGLLRSEMMLSELFAQLPLSTWLQPTYRSQLVAHLATLIGRFTEAFAPRAVFYRSLDTLPTMVARFGDRDQAMPGMYRGTAAYRQHPDLLEFQLEALVRVRERGYRNLHLILPFVRGVEEFQFCRQRVEQMGLTAASDFQLWIMAEVPAVVFSLSELIAAGVNGIAIGTNDLTQFLLGVERDRPGHLDYDERHPAVLQAFEQLITTAASERIFCCVCGQAPVKYPELVDRFIQWGVTSISVEPNALRTTQQAIYRAEQRLILDSLRSRE